MFTHNELNLIYREFGLVTKKVTKMLESEKIGDSRKKELEVRLSITKSIYSKLAEHLEKKVIKQTVTNSSKLLVIDDYQSVRLTLNAFLKNIGFDNVDLAENAIDGLKMLRQAEQQNTPYSLVISDWEMPEMTGLELLKSVRSDSSLADMPFYLLTSYDDPDFLREATRAGVTGYMNKPISQTSIKEVLSDYLK